MQPCKLCENKFGPDEMTDGVCFECYDRHAFVPPAPALRPRIPCSRCHATSFVRCLAIRERSATGGQYGAQYVSPLSATYAHAVEVTLFRGREVTSPDFTKPLGTFEAYICRGCGFVEWYARSASEIPIGPGHATELFEIEADGVYR